MKAFAGTTEAAGQLGKDAWKQTKKKKLFFFKANLLIPKGEFSEESDIFRGRCTCLNEHIYHLFTNKKDILLKFCGISHAGR